MRKTAARITIYRDGEATYRARVDNFEREEIFMLKGVCSTIEDAAELATGAMVFDADGGQAWKAAREKAEIRLPPEPLGFCTNSRRWLCFGSPSPKTCIADKEGWAKGECAHERCPYYEEREPSAYVLRRLGVLSASVVKGH